MLEHLSRTKIAFVWVAIAVVSAGAAWLGSHREHERLTADLVTTARRCAVAFDGDELRQLSGARADVSGPVYAAVKRRLIELQALNPRVRFIYIFRAVPETTKVIFLGDSATVGAKDESLPGDDYPQAAASPGLQEILRTGLPTTEGPLQDDFGKWITGYAPINQGSGPWSGARGREVLGLDVPADEWNREVWLAALKSASYACLLLGIPFGAWLIIRRQNEQREAIRNLSEAMEQSHSALMVVDLDSCIEYANRGLCQQIGYSRRELIGRKWRDFQVHETSPEVLAELVASVRSGKSWEGEWFNRRKDGVVYPVRGIVTPVRGRDGALACFVAVFDDMTEIKRKEAELRDARDLAQAGDRAKGQFLATMSHEVRTPLNGIVGFTDLLLDTPLSAEQRDFVQTIRTSGESLIQLTGDILDYARIESGKLALEPAVCDPRECVEDALDLFAAAAAAKQIELLHWIEDGVPATVLADGGRVRQVLMNLVNNAVKFTERGEVEVVVALATGDLGAGAKEAPGAPGTDGIQLKFSVRDTGIGIAGVEIPKLFQPFSQLDATTTRKYGGTGLGLAISRNLTQLMGGEIAVVSEPGSGSVFSFTVRVPVVEPARAVPLLSDLRLALIGPPGARRRELVRLARRWGAPTVEADDPATLKTGTWDVALIDLDGDLPPSPAVAAERLGQLPPAQTIGLVPISLAGERRTALRAHFHALVNKPLHHDALFTLLSGRRAEPEAARTNVSLGLRVLLVEDNVVNQRLIQKALTNLGCPWTVAENGRRAIEELLRDGAGFDLVLMDLHMPEMDGLTAIAEIRAGRAGAKAQALWIAALTADVRVDQRERAFAAGVNDYMTKPIKQSDLEAGLRRFIDAPKPAAE